MVGHFDADFVVSSIEYVVRWKISDGILVAKFVADILERLIQIVHVIREKGSAPGFFRQLLENLVPVRQMVFAVRRLVRISLRERNPLRACADGVNDHAGALRHFDGIGACVRR